MTKQQLAQKRNWMKMRLMGFRGFDLDYMTEEELHIFNIVRNGLDVILADWDKCSKQLGLNVQQKCWCGKPATEINEETMEHVCKNHKQND